MEILDNPQLKLAFEFVQNTNKNVFLTGKAGTGKTTFLKRIKTDSSKRMIIVAPTGVAAINAGGVTIHSFFQIPFGPFIPKENIDINASETSKAIHKFNRNKINIIKSMDLLVIDEISMVRADLLDAIDDVLRRYKNRNKPFGGIQLLMIGDLHQLAPIVKDDEQAILSDYYDSYFFFGSRALQKTDYVSVELTHIFRQSDLTFIDLLGKVREKNLTSETLAEINKRFILDFVKTADDGFITLTTHNHQSKTINDSKLKLIKTKSYKLKAIINGDFPEYSYPTDIELELKIGAQVMFVKNDSSFEKRYFNGKIGTVIDIEDDLVRVKCSNENEAILVGKEEWKNMKYSIDEISKEINETTIGTFIQHPLKLAWAITIHKSQGLTFDKVIIDANSAFAHGQVYVALSRCRTLEGLILSSPISNASVINDSGISIFTKGIEKNQPSEAKLEMSKQEFQKSLVDELFDFALIQRRLQYVLKLLKENSSSVNASIIKVFEDVIVPVKTNIVEVADKFRNQISQIVLQNKNVETNDLLQERVIKASIYFIEKVDFVFKTIPVSEIDSDNKNFSKVINEAISKLLEDIFIKMSCLKSCKDGFLTNKYLDARAKASIENVEVKKSRTEKSYKNIENGGLYIRLKRWRSEKAFESDVPAYMVLKQKTLNDIVSKLPLTIDSLKSIKGFGKQKAKFFGTEILEIIFSYCDENKIERPAQILDTPDVKKLNTKQITFEMFANGLTIFEISKERKLSLPTIEGHIAYFVGLGEIEISKLLPKDKIENITNYYTNINNYSLSKAKEILGDDYAYSDLRFVYKHLEYEGKIKI